ncbi:MAG: hypothetical protein KKH22_11845 [Proteobacteria bacterium]|nr:hypothetical protein [Pseudomonadota bacterium]
MPRKLRIDSLSAELTSVKRLLEEAIQIGDPVGQIQYKERENSIIKELETIKGEFDTQANVAIYFGGKPVLGSRGISAEFASTAIEEFQNLISKVQAFNLLGRIGERGRVPEVANSNLMITEVTKGSFGFILEELTDQSPLFDSSLKNTVDLVSNIIAKTCDQNEEFFEEILPQIDSRTLISLQKFLINLDNNDASLRIIENDMEFIIDEESAHRGRLRIESTVIEEDESLFEGVILGFLPEHRKFELKLLDGQILYGSVTIDATEQYTALAREGISVINELWTVSLETRNIKPLNRPERQVYKLKRFIQKLDQKT